MTEMSSQNLSVKKCTVGYSLKYVLLGGSLDSCEQFCVGELGTFLVFFSRNGGQKALKKWKQKVFIFDNKKVVFFRKLGQI